MKKLFWTCLIVCLSALAVAGQESPKKDGAVLLLSPGISYQGQLFGELNLVYAIVDVGHGYVIGGPRLGVEANFKRDRFIYAPKIGYELSGMLVALRGSGVGYIDNDKLDLRILPEVGFDFFFGSLMYGYSLPILAYKSSEVTRHKISLSARLHRDIWYELRK